MQDDVLAQYPSADLRVYAIWLPMLWSDARRLWDGTIMSDPRVIHFWDGERTIGAWFSEKLEGYEGVVWDAYYLYGPDAEWENVPAPLVASGGTIYGEREKLETHIRNLLEE